VSVQQLKIVQDKLNNRPRKVLGFYTPNEMIKRELENKAQGYSNNFLSH
jgi:IS30 family transposase